MTFSYRLNYPPGHNRMKSKQNARPFVFCFIIFLVDVGKQQNFWAQILITSLALIFNNQVPGKLVVSVS